MEVAGSNKEWVLLPSTSNAILSRPSGRHGKQEELLVDGEIAAALNAAEAKAKLIPDRACSLAGKGYMHEPHAWSLDLETTTYWYCPGIEVPK